MIEYLPIQRAEKVDKNEIPITKNTAINCRYATVLVGTHTHTHSDTIQWKN